MSDRAERLQEDASLRRGLMLILSSPSGAGKTTLSRLLLQQYDKLELSVSVTTRPRRPSEVDGTHYHFISERKFAAMRERDELLEWAEVHGHFYGTPREAVEEALTAGRDVLFDIDWQGTEQITAAMRDDVVSVFILPPSMAELRARLERRAEDSPQVIAARLANAREEIAHWTDYDYVRVNRDLDETFAELRAILAAERMKRPRREAALAAFVSKLLAEPVD